VDHIRLSAREKADEEGGNRTARGQTKTKVEGEGL
jgi:hypothetical protein